jgi:hypothetical protein
VIALLAILLLAAGLTFYNLSASGWGRVYDLSRVYDGGSLLIYDGITIINPPPPAQ